MIKKSIIACFILVLLITSKDIFGQSEVGKHYVGPSIGLAFLGSSFQFGLNHEYLMDTKEIGLDAPGTIGVGGLFRYWSYSESLAFGKWKYTNVLIGAQANYHFKLNDAKLDPWAGIILAYNSGSVSYDGPGGGVLLSTPSPGGFFIGLNGGIRYWVSPKVAVTGRVGFGSLSYGVLDVGVDFKL